MSAALTTICFMTFEYIPGAAQSVQSKQSPALAEQVKAGKPSPVEERVPEKLLAVPVVEKIGEYAACGGAPSWGRPTPTTTSASSGPLPVAPAMSHTACRHAPRSVQPGDGAAPRCQYGLGDRWDTLGKVPVGSCQ
jgi:hypothetical protein